MQRTPSEPSATAPTTCDCRAKRLRSRHEMWTTVRTPCSLARATAASGDIRGCPSVIIGQADQIDRVGQGRDPLPYANGISCARKGNLSRGKGRRGHGDRLTLEIGPRLAWNEVRPSTPSPGSLRYSFRVLGALPEPEV